MIFQFGNAHYIWDIPLLIHSAFVSNIISANNSLIRSKAKELRLQSNKRREVSELTQSFCFLDFRTRLGRWCRPINVFFHTTATSLLQSSNVWSPFFIFVQNDRLITRDRFATELKEHQVGFCIVTLTYHSIICYHEKFVVSCFIGRQVWSIEVIHI